MRARRIQDGFMLLREISGPIMRLDLHGTARYRSVLEVSGTPLTLLEEHKMSSLYDLYHRLFLSLDFPLQIIARIQELDIELYLQHVETLSTAFDQEGECFSSWRALARDHAATLRALSTQHPLVSRRFYAVLPAEESVFARWGRKKYRQEMDLSEATYQLRLRSELVASHLQSMGLSCRLLGAKHLAHFYSSFFFPDPPLVLSADQENGKLPIARTIRIKRDSLEIDSEHVRVQTVEVLPRVVTFGWLKSLLETNEPFDLVFHLVPRQAHHILPYLRRRQAHAQASILHTTSEGKLTDTSATIANTDLTPLIEQITTGEQRMLESSLSLLIRASSREELERRTERIEQQALTTFTHYSRTSFFEQAETFRACLPGHPRGHTPLLLPSAIAASMIPFLDHLMFSPSERAILEGTTLHNEPVVVDWWRDVPNANRLILGPSGWGKSYKAKLDLLHLYYVYKNLAERQGATEDGFQIVVIDPERETNRSLDFSLIGALGGQSVRFSPGSHHRLNPLDLPPVAPAEDLREDLLANHIHRLHQIFDCMLAHTVDDAQSTLTPQEKSLLDAALYETYRRAGIYSDRATHQRPAPLLKDLLAVLSDEQVCGPDPTGLVHRLRRYTHGSLSSLFSERTNISLNNTVIQFDVRDLESELRPIGLMLISQYIWNIAFSSPLPRFLVIDELATIGRYKAGQIFLEEMFQRARKHYLSVTGITQHTEHLTKSIIANCATHLLLHQDNSTIDDVMHLFKLSEREGQLLRGFGRGEALLLANGKRLALRFHASPQEDKLITTNRRQIAAIETQFYSTQPMLMPIEEETR